MKATKNMKVTLSGSPRPQELIDSTSALVALMEELGAETKVSGFWFICDHCQTKHSVGTDMSPAEMERSLLKAGWVRFREEKIDLCPECASKHLEGDQS